MKEKMISFIKAKRDLVIFSIVLLASIVSIGLIAKFSREEETNLVNDIIEEVPNDNNDEVPDTNLEEKKTFIAPIEEEYVICRQYFDINDKTTMNDAIIVSNTFRKTSKGLGLKKEDNSLFDVISIYDGIIKSVDETGLYGTCVTIDHGSGIVAKYYSLDDVLVSEDEYITKGSIIAKSGTSLMDNSLGNYVFLEILVNDEYVNPNTIFGKEISSIAVEK